MSSRSAPVPIISRSSRFLSISRAMSRAPAWTEPGVTIWLIQRFAGGADPKPEGGAILAPLDTAGPPPVLALNKVDVVRPETLLGLSQRLNERLPFAATFMISALSGSGV